MRTFSLCLLVAACHGAASDGAKVYVCAQNAGLVQVFDAGDLSLRATIELGAGRLPHNVEARADQVLVTSADGAGEAPDELVVIDPRTDTIRTRIPIEPGAFLAHVVSSPDERTAWVTGWGSGRLYRVDLVAGALTDTLPLGGAAPHGLRLSPDGATLYVADTNGHVLELDAATMTLERIFPTAGSAIQVAVTDDRVYATISVPPEVDVIDRATGEVTAWAPDGARGFAQILLGDPDGRTILVADQGNPTNRGQRVLILDATTGAVMGERATGLGAHGLDRHGDRAFVTGAYDDTLAAIDLSEDGPPIMAATGANPNGVAVWTPVP